MHVLLGDRLPEARPTGARVEFGRGTEERGVAANATEQTFVMDIPIRASERALGARFSSDVKREWGELLPPIRFGLLHFRDAHSSLAFAGVGKLNDEHVGARHREEALWSRCGRGSGRGENELSACEIHDGVPKAVKPWIRASR
jgi:hypothetical protein